MRMSISLFRCAAALLGGMVFALPAGAAGQPGGASPYADMCVQAADMPVPFGESDLKGNPKLQQYCGCFDKKFAARAMKAMQQRSSGQAPPPQADIQKEELAMRNSCRKELGLPPAPNKADSAR